MPTITRNEAEKKRAMTEEGSLKLVADSCWAVKNVKFHAGHDGDGFNLSLYKGTTRVATVYDDSYGGGFQYTWLVKGVEKEFNAESSSMCEPWKYSDEDEFMVYGEDTYIDRLISIFETDKQFRKHCKTKTCFKLKTQADGEFFTINTKYSPVMKERLKTKHGDDLEVIYNEKY